MHTNWKVYAPDKEIKAQEFVHSIQQLLNVYSDAFVQLVSTKNTLTDIQKLNALNLEDFENFTGTISLQDASEYLNLLSSDHLLDNSALSNKNHTSPDEFGFSIIKKSYSKQLSLEIHLPFANRSKSTEKLLEILLALNGAINLQFVNEEHIKTTASKLIDNLFDDKYKDGQWSWTNGDHLYKASNKKKGQFEDNNETTYRATGISVSLMGSSVNTEDYNNNLVSTLIEIFAKDELVLTFDTNKKELLPFLMGEDIDSIALSTVFDITNLLSNKSDIDFGFLLSEQGSSLAIELEPALNSKAKEFLYRLNRSSEDSFEIKLEVDKEADEDFIRLFEGASGVEMNYSHDA